MAKQTINVGTAVNTRNGDNLRDAFTKANSNFTELYNLTSVNSQIPSQTDQSGKVLKTNGLVLAFGNISYNELTDRPTMFSGSYNDLTNKPLLFSGNYNDLSNKPTLFSGSYNDLTNKPASIPSQTGNNGKYLTTDGSSLSWTTIVIPSNTWNDVTGKPTFATVATTGSYTDLINKPSSFSGSYNDLTDKPTLFSGAYANLTGKPSLFSGSYNDLTDKPSLFSGSYNDLSDKPSIPSLSGYATESYVTTQITNLINGAPTTLDTLKEIADQLSSDESAVSALTSSVASKISLTNLSVTTASASGSGSLSYNNTTGVFTFTPASLSTYVTSSSLTTTLGDYVTTTNFTWNNLSYKPSFATVATSGSYNDLTNKPTLFSGAYADLTGKPTLATVATTGSYTDLTNKPSAYTLPTASGSVLGGIKIGTGLSIDGSGVVSTSYTANQNLSSTSNVTFNNVTTTGQIVESFQSYSTSITSGSTVTLNCASGSLWNITSSVAGNWTAAVTNVSVTTGQATNVTLIITQGATAYIPSALTVNGTSATINWQGGTAPTGNNNKKDVVSFSILQTGASTYLVFGQLVTFG